MTKTTPLPETPEAKVEREVKEKAPERMAKEAVKIWSDFNTQIAGDAAMARPILAQVAAFVREIPIENSVASRWCHLAALMLERIANGEDEKKVLWMKPPAHKLAGKKANDNLRLWLAVHEKRRTKKLSATAAVDAVHKEEVKKNQRKGQKNMPIARKTIKNNYERLNRLYNGRKANKSIAEHLADIPAAAKAEVVITATGRMLAHSAQKQAR